MSISETPPTPPREPRSAVVTILLLVIGIVLLAPGVCALFFIKELGAFITPSSQIIPLWAICFLISALGVFILHRTCRQARGQPPADP